MDSFRLKWSSFQGNVIEGLRDLRNYNEFLDVSLFGDHGTEKIDAHKVVLSAGSPFFHRILRNTPHGDKQSLYLRGVNHVNLKLLVEFLYQGEVNVPQENIDGFLAVTEDLEIKGLCKNTPTGIAPPTQAQYQMQNQSFVPQQVVPSGMMNAGQPSQQQQMPAAQIGSRQSINAIANAPSADENENGNEENNNYAMDDDQFDPKSLELGPGEYNIIKLEDGGSKCVPCGKEFVSYHSARRHYQTTHSNRDSSIECDLCPSVAANRNALIEHLRGKHGIYNSSVRRLPQGKNAKIQRKQ